MSTSSSFTNRFSGPNFPSLREHVHEIVRLYQQNNTVEMQEHINVYVQTTIEAFAVRKTKVLTSEEQEIENCFNEFMKKEGREVKKPQTLEEQTHFAYEQLDHVTSCSDIYLRDKYIPCNPGDKNSKLDDKNNKYWMSTNGAPPFEPGPICQFFRKVANYNPLAK